MKNKLYLIIPLLLLLTGCTVNYNLNIDQNKITENISGTVTNKEITPEIEGRSDVNPQYYYLYLDDSALTTDSNEKYTKEITDIEDGKKFNFNYTYNGNYDKSKLINNCFENHIINENDEYYYIKLSGKFSCLYSDKININVISNYEVLDNNAQKVDGNKYTWVIDSSNNVNITLTVSKTIEYSATSKAKTFSTFQLVGLIIFVLLTIVTYILYKKKNSGKV